MQSDELDEADFFAATVSSGARALLIGRRALVALGAPVLTADYDFWLHPEDIEGFNQALQRLDLYPTRNPDEARQVGRYALEGGVRVDVMVARVKGSSDGTSLSIEDALARRQTVDIAGHLVGLPSLDDLITTKRWASREKDLADIQLLEALKRENR